MTPRSTPETGSSVGSTETTENVDDVAALGYEDARDELVAVVARLEAGASTLEESLALWERGEALAARCQQWLDGARERLASARDGDRGSHDVPDDTGVPSDQEDQ
ncbi:exodeoxyribonuclease VII small subunit [Luteimicrobium subarcticum]|uniref:Exodeoxyribonuclease 7 small subunit n=1 Tax=Luteimicrobium subarcticum TaxID=620910 RepID=A0A2M8WUQ0_9MICO|nr:exodeoxyribonuclease VII small subunit [Luteimicrobium subarcticum]PJI94667.1 exodeoxyribonuclease VII small subunit [Luteimicrobium subarcticum]